MRGRYCQASRTVATADRASFPR
nr:hypothetical protein [Mesorhizobium sp. M4A.F.Ca.ET.022.05.2.1]